MPVQAVMGVGTSQSSAANAELKERWASQQSSSSQKQSSLSSMGPQVASVSDGGCPSPSKRCNIKTGIDEAIEKCRKGIV